MHDGHIASAAALIASALLFACDGPVAESDAGQRDAGGQQAHDGGTTAHDAGHDAGHPEHDSGPPVDAGAPSIQTVFVIVMENHNWDDILGDDSAPYFNSLLTRDDVSYADEYYNPPDLHPSEPNYIWMEAGDDLGIDDDHEPSDNHQATTDHFVTQLEAAGFDWRSYQEGIDGTECPLENDDLYAPKHNPMVYFDDVTDTNDPNSARCIEHVRPFEELAADLASGDVKQYNFITPDLCHDMHNFFGCDSLDTVENGDTWLSTALPMILESDAYANNGAIFITWDEGEGSDGPIGMIVLSPLAKGHGYHNSIMYTHSSFLRTVETIFHVPFLRDAENATDLSDLFATFP